jgi:formamidopyrimidine-DNA glycosylase
MEGSPEVPELPEVEIVCRGLNDAFVGHRLTKVIRRFDQLRWPIPDDLETTILGASPSGDAGVLRSVQRRSKYLLLGFDTGTLLIHLGMSGTLRRMPWGRRPGRMTTSTSCSASRSCVSTIRGAFGAVLWHGGGEAVAGSHVLLQRLGVEPFSESFTARLMFDATRGRKASIKQVLLSGAIVVGVGNIYASESLFRAGIRPTERAGRISKPRYGRLVTAIRQTLTEAIAQAAAPCVTSWRAPARAATSSCSVSSTGALASPAAFAPLRSAASGSSSERPSSVPCARRRDCYSVEAWTGHWGSHRTWCDGSGVTVAMTCHGKAAPILIGYGCRRSCCSRHRWQRSSPTSTPSSRPFPRWANSPPRRSTG